MSRKTVLIAILVLAEVLIMKRIGYARVSTQRQDGDSQIAQLDAAGCTAIFSEKVSTRVFESDRSKLQQALNTIDAGDVLIVTKLDRLGRTQVEVINRLHKLQQEGKPGCRERERRR